MMATKKQKSTHKLEAELINEDLGVSHGAMVYADKITTFAFGSSVSKLGLAIEVGPEKYVRVATIVLPTPTLIQAIEFMVSTLKQSENMKLSLIQGANAFIEQLKKDTPVKKDTPELS